MKNQKRISELFLKPTILVILSFFKTTANYANLLNFRTFCEIAQEIIFVVVIGEIFQFSLLIY